MKEQVKPCFVTFDMVHFLDAVAGLPVIQYDAFWCYG